MLASLACLLSGARWDGDGVQEMVGQQLQWVLGGRVAAGRPMFYLKPARKCHLVSMRDDCGVRTCCAALGSNGARAEV